MRCDDFYFQSKELNVGTLFQKGYAVFLLTFPLLALSELLSLSIFADAIVLSLVSAKGMWMN